MPTDVEHKSSRATQEQRQRFAEASRRWADLPDFIKREFSQKYDFVYRHHSPGLSFVDLLKGQHLFISQEIHAQEYHDSHVKIPHYVCIITRSGYGRVWYPCPDPQGPITPYHPTLTYKRGTRWYTARRYPLQPGNTLFYPIPDDVLDFTVTPEAWYRLQWPAGYTAQTLHLKPFYIITGPAFFYTPWNGSIVDTFFPSKNLNFLQHPDPDVLYYLNLHDWISYPNTYYADPAHNFLIRLIPPGELLKITITPINVRQHAFLFDRYPYPQYRYWYIQRTTGGQCTLFPTQRSVIVKKSNGAIVTYED